MAERVVRNVEKDYLICSICLGRYRDPRLLPCGHSFCKECLQDHIRETVQDRHALFFTCPNDRTQVTRPHQAVNHCPREWANSFPTDTFLNSLLHAVRLHEAATADKQDSPLSCSQHGGRLLEFYCFGCSTAVCPYCAVRDHRGRNCECIAMDEAVERVRPRIDALQQTLQRNIQFAQQICRGERDDDGALRNSKDAAYRGIDDVEYAITGFLQTAVHRLAELRQQTREAGKGHVNGQEQVAFVLENLNAARESFDSLCERGTGSELLGVLPKLEAQAQEYEAALGSARRGPGIIQVDFVPNVQLLQFLRNCPPIGSVRISGDHRTQSTPRDVRTAYATPRQVAGSPTSSTPRLVGVPTAAVRPTLVVPVTARGLRNKTSFSVKTSCEQGTNCHLTGITCVGESVIVADVHNNKLRQCNFARALSLRNEVTLDGPIGVTTLSPTTDVAVTLPEKNQIVIVSTEGGLNVRESITTQKPYEGICYLGNTTVAVTCCVTGRQSVDIVDLRNGRVVKSIGKDDSGQPLFTTPKFIASTTTGNVIVSDREQNLLVCLDQDAHVRWNHTTSASPWGVSSDENGNIYLCLDNCGVQLLDENGRVVEDKFVSARDGIKVPYAICARGGHVALTEWGSNLFVPNSPWVHVFTI